MRIYCLTLLGEYSNLSEISLGARGDSMTIRPDVRNCGILNPVLLPSAAVKTPQARSSAMVKLAKSSRHLVSARRVEITPGTLSIERGLTRARDQIYACFRE